MRPFIRYAMSSTPCGRLYRYDATYAGQTFCFRHIASPLEPRQVTAHTLRNYRAVIRRAGRAALKQQEFH